jgi:N-acetyl-gamma-glutamyl-phosphate reductase
MKYKIFVDGQEGTTGLKIHERLSKRKDLEILNIEPEHRKDPEKRKILINEADIVFLCLPDDASRESVTLLNNDKTRIIDASTAHRTNDSWTYGLPELNKTQRKSIAASHRVSVPGCHATGIIMSLIPLINNGIMSPDYPVTCTSITGYSGGGKKMIGQYENSEIDNLKFKAPRIYGLNQNHKHLPEITKHSGLSGNPLFTPVVSNYFNGMITSVPIISRLLNKKIKPVDAEDIFSEYFKSEYFVKVNHCNSDEVLDNGFLTAVDCNNTNNIEIFIFGHDDKFQILTRFDNLGKGASGAALQNMNILLGLDEKTGFEN